MDIYLQLLWNSTALAALFALSTAAFSVVYSVTRVLYVAVGGVVLVSGYVFYFSLTHGFGWLGAVVFAVVISGALGWILNTFVYENLRRSRPITGTAGMLASVAVLIVLQNLALLLWSSQTIVVHSVFDTWSPWIVAGVRVSVLSVVTLAVAAVLIVALFLFMRCSRTGRAMRAVSDHEEMAEVVGVNTRRIRQLTFVGCSALAGVAGILAALHFNLEPSRAVNYAIEPFSVAVVGGLGSVGGAVVGAFLFQLLSNLGGYWFAAGLRTLFTFIVAFLFLLLRPQGLFGKKRI